MREKGADLYSTLDRALRECVTVRLRFRADLNLKHTK